MTTRELVSQYVEVLCKIYGKHLKTVILYGSYARRLYKGLGYRYYGAFGFK